MNRKSAKACEVATFAQLEIMVLQAEERELKLVTLTDSRRRQTRVVNFKSKKIDFPY